MTWDDALQRKKRVLAMSKREFERKVRNRTLTTFEVFCLLGACTNSLLWLQDGEQIGSAVFARLLDAAASPISPFSWQYASWFSRQTGLDRPLYTVTPNEARTAALAEIRRRYRRGALPEREPLDPPLGSRRRST